MTYIVSPKHMTLNWKIVVVGVGGTGSAVASGLCRLLIGRDTEIVLIDPDRVEEHNLLRQDFLPGDVGRFKSQVLAERLARQYGRGIRYSVWPYDHEMVGEVSMGGMGHTPLINGLIIGCVDGPIGRAAIAKGFKDGRYTNWWLDSGNGRNSGQVLIGNCVPLVPLFPMFDEGAQEVMSLPIPSVQLPSLLAPVPAGPQRDCAEEVIENDQSATINQAMATLVLTFVHKFLTNSLTWMQAWIDLEAGTLRVVPAEPVTVARMLSVKVDDLIKQTKKGEEKHGERTETVDQP